MTDCTDLTDEQETQLQLESVRADRWALAYTVDQLERHDKFLRNISADIGRKLEERDLDEDSRRFVNDVKIELEVIARAINVLKEYDIRLAIVQAFLENPDCNPYVVRVAPEDDS